MTLAGTIRRLAPLPDFWIWSLVVAVLIVLFWLVCRWVMSGAAAPRKTALALGAMVIPGFLLPLAFDCLPADVAKKRHRRNVDISANLAAWLVAYRKPEGKVMLTLSNYRRHLARLIKATDIKIPYNAGRHAFSSYAYVKHGAETTARWLGHADGNLLLTTYKGLVTQSEADKFWSIKPKALEKTNIIRLKQAVGT